MIKELALQVINELDSNVTAEELIDAIITRLCIEKGLKDIEEGNVTTNEVLLEEIKSW